VWTNSLKVKRQGIEPNCCDGMCAGGDWGALPQPRDRETPNDRYKRRHRRMIEDMTVRSLPPATRRWFLHAVAKFARFLASLPYRSSMSVGVLHPPDAIVAMHLVTRESGAMV